MTTQPRATGKQRTYTGAQLSEIAFPLGGIGTGTISLGGRGNLRDFEIFNRPAKGNVLAHTHFALWASAPGQPPVAKLLEGRVPPPYRSAGGESPQRLTGVSRFAEVGFTGEYPVATLELTDPAMPVQASLRAWNPFIPLNVRDSALPVAIFEWTLTNPTNVPVEVSLAASLSNPLTMKNAEGKPEAAGSLNAYRDTGTTRGILLSHPGADPTDPATGTLALATSGPDIDVQTHWYRGGWWDGAHLFWDTFAATGRLNTDIKAEPSPPHRGGDVCSIALRATVPAGGTVTLPVVIGWHFPVMENPWRAAPDDAYPTLATYVGVQFADAWAVAEYVGKHADRLRADTERWRTAIFESTLPGAVLEAITTQASIMRSPTCFLLADGAFFGWEGCNDHGGCCHGNCTHVWNYEQAVAFLFPELERTMRRTEFLHNTRDTGNMAFRTQLPPGSKLWDFKPCADGQMGTIIQVYRDWQLSGDDDFLREIWPNVKRALEYAWTMTPEKMDAGATAGAINTPGEVKRSIDSLWDPDKDGVMEGEQHNTYDIEFYGPNTLCTAMYLGALRAGEEIARHFGEIANAEEYRAIYESGRAKVDAELWNGEYYRQHVRVIDGVTVPDVLKSPQNPSCGPACACKQGMDKQPVLGGDGMPKYQYGDGCLSDQLLGQWAAHVAGLGHLLDPAKVRGAVQSIFTYNFRNPIGSFSNVQRVYALNEEAGLLLCSWPHGNRPTLPFVYCDEVWTGIEYHVAAHLIYEGLVDEGLEIVTAISERYAGHNRNPWNQVECGHHYARAMASWSVKLALDGFSYSLPEGRLGFAPKHQAAQYRTFWSTGAGWGRYSQQTADGSYRLEVLYGTQTLRCLQLIGLTPGNVTVTGPAGSVAAHAEAGYVDFATPVTLVAGQALEIHTTVNGGKHDSI